MHSAQQLTIIGSRHELFSGYQTITQQKNRAAMQSVSARTAMAGQDMKNNGGRREKYENIRDVTICIVFHIPRMTPFSEFFIVSAGIWE
jgi:hypothetical protein